MSSPGDANDYSRFEKIQDDEEQHSTPDQQSSLIETISKAQAHKDQGNQHFKVNSLKLAKESYEDGLLLLDSLKSASAIDSLPNKSLQEDVRNLVVSFYSNLSMISIKEESWFRALTNASKAIELDSSNVKCLYRRAVANAKLSQHDEAIADLNTVLTLDPSNASAKKELVEALKAQKDQKKKEAASFGKIFSKGSSLYDDREKERAERVKRAEEQKFKDESEWKQSNEDRISKGLEIQTFDDWKKTKEEENKKKSDAPSSSAPPKVKAPTKPKPPTQETSNDPEELYDEEEKRILEETKSKGYCYFKETAGNALITFYRQTLNLILLLLSE
jgi:tetratricopeptide (TPR) repeat protein